MRSPKPPGIPAFLSIDVEPDKFQMSRNDERAWAGYDAVFQFLVTLRDELARVSGAVPRFGWYFRMDPQIKHVCGCADTAISRFADRQAALAADGDYFGVHAHPLRWSAKEQVWVHDFDDSCWVRECINF